MYFEAFTGGMYQTLSPYAGADQCINLYAETRQVDGSQKRRWLFGTPGLDLVLTADTSGCRGLFSQDGRSWGVWGDTLYELDLDANTASAIGTVQDDGGPVSFASNGQGGDQLGLVSGGSEGNGALYVLDLVTDVFSTVSLPFTGPVMLTFLDGYGLINQHESPIVWYSAIEDMTDWDALDFFTRSRTSDNIKAIAVTRDRIWTIGSRTTTLYYNSGDVDTPFLPYPGTTIQQGMVTHWAFGVYDDVLYWVAQSDTGVARVVRAVDPSPVTMSTPPIAQFLDDCPTLDDAEIFVYGQAEHTFVVVTAPSSTADVQTYCFDELEQLWHARADWNLTTGRYMRWRARGVMEFQNKVYVGDYNTGKLYGLNLATYTNQGDVLVRERIAPYLATDPQWAFVEQAQLLAQTGVGIESGQGSDPEVELQISRDGAQTWSSVGVAKLGALGNYLARVIWRPRCRVRQDLFVLRVRQSDPVKTAWAGMTLNVSPGTGQL